MSSLSPRIDKIQKNYLINSNMLISQRGTSFAAAIDGQYTLDRWQYGKLGTMAHTVSQDTDVPSVLQSGYLFQNSLRLNLTTPDTSITSTDFTSIRQKIEGYNFANLAQKDFTLSFWVKATLTGTYCVSFRNSGTDRSYVAEYTINATNTWEKKVINVLASPAGGSWNYTNGTGLIVDWTLASNATLQTTPGVWQTGNYIATSNIVNGVNTGATDFRITGTMINEGVLEDPSFTTFGQSRTNEIAACQRYYEKSYDINTAVDTLTSIGNYEYLTVGNNAEQHNWTFKVTKRIAPAIQLKDPVSGTAGQVDRARNVTDGVQVFLQAELVGQQGFGTQTASVVGKLIRFHWTADAEL